MPETAPEPIAPHLARERILQALQTHLGADWQDDDHGWTVIHDGDYYMRLTRADRNLDAQCDLLGEVTLTERELNPTQTGGRLVAWMVLGASLFLAFVIARLTGYLG